MKLIKLVSLTGLVLTSSQLIAGENDNSQVMPPPGPYHSIVNNVPTDSMHQSRQQSPQVNPYNNSMPHGLNAENKPMPATAQVPEWVLKQQQMAKDDIEKMLKENTKRYNENEKKYAEYLKKYQELTEKRENERQQWMADNNKKMMQSWKEMLEQYTKNQKKQIEAAENMPEWMKQQMLKQHEQQLSMMNANPPINMNNMQNRRQTMPNGRAMQAFPQSQMNPMMNRMDMSYPMMQQAPQRQFYMGQPVMTPYNHFNR